jgi:predicted transcriptional regulator
MGCEVSQSRVLIVLASSSRSLTAQEIAERTEMNVNTVKSHLRSLRNKSAITARDDGTRILYAPRKFSKDKPPALQQKIGEPTNGGSVPRGRAGAALS